MISNVSFGENNKQVDNNKRYQQTMYYYPTRPLRPDEVNLSPSRNQDSRSKNGLKLPKMNVQSALGIAASAVVCAFFGKQIYLQAKAEKAEREMAKVLADTAKKAAEKAGQKATDTLGNLAGGNIKSAIMACTDPTLQRAAANEYSKGPGIMSTKRINDILSLANLKNAKPEEIDLKRAIKIMDEKIIGMDEVKEELLDFFVQYNYNIRNGITSKKPLVLCLNGPAGTGKTTVTEVAAEAMNMHYKKISLAGASGKASIKGYESVYTGANMGGVAEGQIEGGTRRVLYCLDEVEKSASSNYNGKVEDTLLSLFDDQAKFADDNLNVPIDISQSIFILTTNEFEKLSNPLKNRVRKIEIKPYGVDIKSQIAKLKMTNELKKNKLDSIVNIKPEAYNAIAEMTQDQGGRETTRNVDTLIKKIVDMVALNENDGKAIDVTSAFVKKELGPVSEKTSIKERILKSAEKAAQQVAQEPESVANKA